MNPSLYDIPHHRLMKARCRAANAVTLLQGNPRKHRALRVWCIVLADIDEALGTPRRRSAEVLFETFRGKEDA